jgi:hypothetical protein
MRENQTVFANFLCKFGEKDMADYLEEVVLPAFTDDTLIRKYGDTTMHFEEVQLLMEDATPVVAGKFIYNMVLRRTHVYEQGVGQVKAPGKLSSAPSAFFVLSLDNHRLIYFGETPSAPDIGRFHSTVQKFLDIKYEAFIKTERRRLRETGEKIKKADVYDLIPKPELKLVPLSGKDSVRDFIARYSKLQSVKIVVLRRNKDIDPAKTMDELDELAQLTGAPNAKLSISNSIGLDTDGVAELVEDVSASGNQVVKLDGVDLDGAKLAGSNDDFSLKPIFDHVPSGTTPRAHFLWGKLKEFLIAGKLKAPEGDAQARAKATKLVQGQ